MKKLPRANILLGLVAFIIGWVFIPFITGTTLSVNPILIAALVLAIILVLRVYERVNIYVVVGLIVGALVSLLLPSAAPTFIDQGIMFLILVVLVMQV